MIKYTFIQLEEGSIINFGSVLSFKYNRDYGELRVYTYNGTVVRYKCTYNEYIEILSIMEVM